MQIKEFYSLLFEEGEGVCWGSDKFATSVTLYDGNNYKAQSEFFCINPLAVNFDFAPEKSWHSVNLGRRADCNVTSYRNILCEFDELSIEDQAEMIKNSGVPYSTLVYSGGKSLHMIISLVDPCPSKEEYVYLVKRVHAKLKHVDTSTSNPSRFSRAPGAIRDNGKEQTLIRVMQRITTQSLLDWLGPAPTEAPEEYVVSLMGKRILWNRTSTFLKLGAPEGEWNKSLFLAVCDMTEAGYTKEEIMTMCSQITGHLDGKDRSTIESAVRKASKNVRV